MQTASEPKEERLLDRDPSLEDQKLVGTAEKLENTERDDAKKEEEHELQSQEVSSQSAILPPAAPPRGKQPQALKGPAVCNQRKMKRGRASTGAAADTAEASISATADAVTAATRWTTRASGGKRAATTAHITIDALAAATAFTTNDGGGRAAGIPGSPGWSDGEIGSTLVGRAQNGVQR